VVLLDQREGGLVIKITYIGLVQNNSCGILSECDQDVLVVEERGGQ